MPLILMCMFSLLMSLGLLTRLIGGFWIDFSAALVCLPAYFEYHAYVRLRFKLAAGLGEP